MAEQLELSDELNGFFKGVVLNERIKNALIGNAWTIDGLNTIKSLSDAISVFCNAPNHSILPGEAAIIWASITKQNETQKKKEPPRQSLDTSPVFKFHSLDMKHQFALMKAIKASRFESTKETSPSSEITFLKVTSSFLHPIYIRPSYLQLYAFIRPLLQETKLSSVRLLGTPGIGKTYFSLFFMKHLIDDDVPFIYDSYSSETGKPLKPLFIYKGQILKLREENSLEILNNTKALFYIVDGKPPSIDISRLPNVSTLLVCSPRTDYFTAFEKNAANLVRPIHRLYLPTWSWDELIVANSIFNLSLEDLGRRFNMCGGVPRIVFSDSENEIRMKIDRAIADSDLIKLEKFIDSNCCSNTVSHLLINLAVFEDLMTIRAVFASDFIQRLVEEHLEIDIQNELVKFFDSDARGSHFSNFKGALFEIAFERFIVNVNNKSTIVIDLENIKPGEKLNEEELVEEKLPNWVTEKESRKADFRFEDLISRNGGENILWKMNKNFPTFDFLYFDRNEKFFNLYQVTTNPSHDAKWTSKTDQLLNTIDPQQQFKIRLIFCLPKCKFKKIKKKKIQCKEESTDNANNTNRNEIEIAKNVRPIYQFSMKICEINPNNKN